jgi:uncharacterized protein (DUF1684 family)
MAQHSPLPVVPSIALLLCGIAIGTACGVQAPDTRDYTSRLVADRAEKDAEFLKASGPVPDSRKSALLPLAYFPVDESYNVPARLKPSTDRAIFSMPTSSGQPRQERRAGTLVFTLQGQPMTLTAFVEADAPNMDRLFVPFSDETSGHETYAAGRFIDLDRTGTGIYELDFNRAYTPYCYYNPSYECPYPPPENRLKLPVRAGERLKQPEGKS